MKHPYGQNLILVIVYRLCCQEISGGVMPSSQWQTSDFGSFKPILGQKTEKLWIYRALFSIMDQSNYFNQNANLHSFLCTFQLCTWFWTKELFKPYRFCNTL